VVCSLLHPSLMPESSLRDCLLLAGTACLVAGLVGCGSSPEKKEAAFLKRGDVYLGQKDYARAMLEYRNAAQLRPGDAEPLYRLGLAYLRVGNPRGSVVALRQALQRNPGHLGAQLKLAEIMAKNGDQEVLVEAEKRLQGLLQEPQKDAEALDSLAVAEARLGKPEDATRILEQAIGTFSGEIRSAVLLAQIKMKQNDLAGAEKILNDLARKSANSPEAALALGRFYMRTQRQDQAEAEFHRALVLNPQFAPALLSLGIIQANSGRADQAEQTYQRISTVPDRDYNQVYGLFLFQHGKTDAALAEFRRLAKRDPDNRAARTRLVAAYVTLHRVPEARKVLADALDRNGQDWEALLQSAAIYLRSGDLASAEKDLDQVISMQRDSAPAHFELAAVKRMRGLPKSEHEELAESLVHDPNYLPARLALVRNYLSANQAKSALELLDTAPPAQQDTREVWIERNWALLGVNDRKAARAGIDKILRASRSPDVLEQDGFFRMTERDFGGARMDAEEILAQDPSNQRGIRLLVDSYGANKQLPAAVDKLRAIAAGHPQSAPVQAAIGEVLLSLGNRSEARKAFNAAVSAEPAFSPAQLGLAHLDFEENQLDSARRRVAALLTAEPTNVTALSAAGDIELRAGSNAAALEKYRSVLAVDESNVPVLISAAGLLVLDSQLEEALKLAQQAVELAPDNPRAQDTLAWVYYRKGIYRSAIDYLKRAASKNPTPLRQYHLALSYMKSGETSLGQQILLAAIQKDPSLPKKDKGW